MKLIILLIGIVSLIHASATSLDASSIMESMNSLTNTVYSYVYGDTCQYNKNLATELPAYLAKHIGAQQEALSMIEKTFSNWDYLRQHGLSQPLALAITGPSGVGKTETANRISDVLYEKYNPKCGTLILRGEDYSSSILQAEGRPKLFNMLKNRIVDHIIKTGGNSFIVFDEIQKVSPGLLEVLIPALEEDGSLSYTKYTQTTNYFNLPFLSSSKSFLSMTSSTSSNSNAVKATDGDSAAVSSLAPSSSPSMASTDNSATSSFMASLASASSTVIKEETATVSTKNCIFLFISDIGTEYMIKFLIKKKKRSLLNINYLRKIIKGVLDKQWKRLKLSTKINEIFFFLPLEKDHIKEILVNKIYNKNELIFINLHTKHIFLHPGILEYLISNEFIEYNIYSLKEGEAAPPATTSSPATTASGIKKEEKPEGGQFEKAVSNIFEDLEEDFDEDVDDSANSGQTTPVGGGVSTSTSSVSSSIPEDDLNQKIFAIRGARAINNAGPLKDLRSLILQKMRPWRPRESINIGYIDESTLKKAFIKWGTNDIEVGHIYLQWCNLDEELVKKECLKSTDATCPELQLEHGLHEFYAFSPLCETIYYGSLNESY